MKNIYLISFLTTLLCISHDILNAAGGTQKIGFGAATVGAVNASAAAPQLSPLPAPSASAAIHQQDHAALDKKEKAADTAAAQVATSSTANSTAMQSTAAQTVCVPFVLPSMLSALTTHVPFFPATATMQAVHDHIKTQLQIADFTLHELPTPNNVTDMRVELLAKLGQINLADPVSKYSSTLNPNHIKSCDVKVLLLEDSYRHAY